MFSYCQLVPLWRRDLRTSGKSPPLPLTFLSVHFPRVLREINMPASSQEPMRCRFWCHLRVTVSAPVSHCCSRLKPLGV